MHLLQCLDLPLRDILRIILPGIFSLFLIDWIAYLYIGHHTLESESATTLVGLMFVIGTVAFAADFHLRCWPWRKKWNRQLTGLRDELRVITKQPSFNDENFGKPMYKIWLEAICEADVGGHLRYVTGLFYTSATLAAVSFLGLIAAAFPFGHELWHIFQTGIHPPTELVIARLATAPLIAIASFAFAWQALGFMDDVIGEGMLAMHSEESEEQLRKLAGAAARSGIIHSRFDMVQQEVRRAIASLRPLEAEDLSSISDAEFVEQLDLRDDATIRCAHVTAYTRDYQSAVLVNGRDNLFNGPTQYRIQSLLRESLAPRLQVTRIRLQVAPGDKALEDCHFGPQTHKEVQRLSLDDAVRLGIIKPNGSVARLCVEYGLRVILMRNGKIIGPNPGLHAALEDVLQWLGQGDRIYDPFAGTRLVEAVARRHGFDVVSEDAVDEAGTTTGFDAFANTPAGRFGLVIVDPLYEDVLPYVTQQLPQLDWKYALVMSGDLTDVKWCKAVGEALDRQAAEQQIAVETWGKKAHFYRRYIPQCSFPQSDLEQVAHCHRPVHQKSTG